MLWQNEKHNDINNTCLLEAYPFKALKYPNSDSTSFSRLHEGEKTFTVFETLIAQNVSRVTNESDWYYIDKLGDYNIAPDKVMQFSNSTIEPLAFEYLVF